MTKKEEGVWRTIRGSRVFIKEGETPQEALSKRKKTPGKIKVEKAESAARKAADLPSAPPNWDDPDGFDLDQDWENSETDEKVSTKAAYVGKNLVDELLELLESEDISHGEPEDISHFKEEGDDSQMSAIWFEASGDQEKKHVDGVLKRFFKKINHFDFD